MSESRQAKVVRQINPMADVIDIRPTMEDDYQGYSMDVSVEEFAMLHQYQEQLMQSALHFGDEAYAYLFAQPTIVRRLASSGKTSPKFLELITDVQRHFTAILLYQKNQTSTNNSIPKDIGLRIFNSGIDPVSLLGLYRLYLSFLQSVVPSFRQLALGTNAMLLDLVTKILFRDMGFLFDGYWAASIEMATREKLAADQLQARTIGLLTKLPQALWSIDVKQNTPIFVSLGTYNQEKLQLEMPIPGLDFMSVEERTRAQFDWARALQGEVVERETPILLPSGETRWFRQGFYPHKNTKGRVVRIDGSLEDITIRKRDEERLRMLANTDPLTGLLNRSHWTERAEVILQLLPKQEQAKLAIILLDLNYFKLINDTHGHGVGDVVLQEVSRRVSTQLPPGSLFARSGGDDFAILLPSISLGVDRPDYVAKQVLEALTAPILHQNQKFYITASMGIALYPEHGLDVMTLLRRAEIAMYGAKKMMSGYAFADPASDRSSAETLLLTSWVRDALDSDGFELLYQPKVDIATRTICGVEALLRLRHPDEGLVCPDRFIRHAEQNGLMGAISDWVLNKAVDQSREWKSQGIHLPISINLTAQAFQDPFITEKISSALNRTNLSADLLEIELTEETLMADLGRGTETVTSLNKLGVTVSIDDFGTGYSSLSYLKRLPIHVLKIDRSFLQDMSVNDHDAVLVRSIIELGHNLGYQVIAEGVETKDVWDLLEILGCDIAQGYYVARPLEEKALLEWIEFSEFHFASPSIPAVLESVQPSVALVNSCSVIPAKAGIHGD